MKIISILILTLFNFNFFAQTEFNVSFDSNRNTSEKIKNIRIDNLENVTIVESKKKTENLFELNLNKVSHLDSIIFVIETKKHLYSCKMSLDKIEKGYFYNLSIVSYRKLLFFKFYNLIMTSNKNEIQTPFYLNRNKK